MNNIEIGKRIRQARKKCNMSQEELGKQLGLNKSTIQRYESGQVQRIKLPILENLSMILNVNPSWIILKSDNPDYISYNDILTKEEKILISIYRNFNDEGQKEALKRIKEMSDLVQYKKSSDVEDVG